MLKFPCLMARDVVCCVLKWQQAANLFTYVWWTLLEKSERTFVFWSFLIILVIGCMIPVQLEIRMVKG